MLMNELAVDGEAGDREPFDRGACRGLRYKQRSRGSACRSQERVRLASAACSPMLSFSDTALRSLAPEAAVAPVQHCNRADLAGATGNIAAPEVLDLFVQVALRMALRARSLNSSRDRACHQGIAR